MGIGIDRELARAALDAVDAGVLIVGPDGVIAFANQAAADLMARSVDELVGSQSLIIGMSATDPDRVNVIHESLRAGLTWTGRTTQSHPDGSVIDVELAISPWGPVDETGTAIVVMRPVAAIDDRDRELALHAEHRAAVMSVMGAVRPEPSVADTTMALCAAVATIAGIDGAMILVRAGESDIVHLGNVGPPLPGFEPGSKVLTENAELLIATTAAGPWWLDFEAPSTRDLIGGETTDALLGHGIRAAGYAALHDGDTVNGVLTVCSMAPDGAERMATMLPLLEQLAGFASLVLAKQATQFGEESVLRLRVHEVIDGHEFSTALQPVVRLGTGEVVGYEALTRFHDLRPPNVRLDEAHLVGLGIELEEACARAAVAAAASLPPDVWLCVNYSPEAIVDGAVGRTLLGLDRRIVVEITEHSQVQSYSAIREVMKAHPHIDVSVDDAGAGFAGLRHIVELEPTFVKLDIGMIHDVDKDPSRAAMVAGMCHFAQATGTRLVAEGIETEDEARTLRDLGVELGQGFHFGRPAIVPTV